MHIKRLFNKPLIVPDMDPRMGRNINGPSLIRVPDWIKNPLGKYYLYFAHHQGTYIRMAYSDRLEGPWTTYEPGTLQLEESFFDQHIASPDVHVDHENRKIRMYYHGNMPPDYHRQLTRLALSGDGIRFTARPEYLGQEYFRGFQWRGAYYAIAMPCLLHRSEDGMQNFVQGQELMLGVNTRHIALLRSGNTLYVFYTIRQDCPERILVAEIDISGDWKEWRMERHEVVLEPETEYEGGNLPLEPSKEGVAHTPVRQLRDPAIFEEDGRIYLIYAVAGESGLAMAEIFI